MLIGCVESTKGVGNGQGRNGSFPQVVFLYKCVPGGGSFLDFNAPDGVDDKIHAVIIDEWVDGKFDILPDLVNGQIVPGPTERTVLHCFYEKLRQFSLNLAFVANECESFRFCHRVSFLSKYTLGRKFSTDFFSRFQKVELFGENFHLCEYSKLE